jgi:peptide/nickel transport system ATP-binding protein
MREAGRQPLVSARGLHVRYPVRRDRTRVELRAVDGVDLELMPGQIVVLAGESGSGKTTLARTLLGLEQPSAGQVWYAGEPLRYRARTLRAYRRQVQLVPQDPTGALNPARTVYQAVAEGLRVHRMTEGESARVMAALARSGLRPPERFLDAYPHELSGGQRQRVVIAGALALGPRLLIADEPVASLDASVRGEILALLLRLRAELALGALVITHDLGLAWNIADQVAVMYLGRIVEFGPTEDVLCAPRHPYTQALLAALPGRGPLPTPLAGEMPDAVRPPAGCRFHPLCPALASGAAARAGVAELCRTVDPVLPPPSAGHATACHLGSPSG